MASSSDKKGEEAPLDKAAAAARVSAALAVVMNSKGNAAAEAALAAAISALKAARENAAQAPAAAIIENNPASSAACGSSAAASRNNKPAMPMPFTEADLELWLKKEKAKKYRRVRLSKDCVDDILSYKSIVRPILPPDQLPEHLDERDAVLYAADADFLQYQRRIREEYEKKGFAYGWETDEEDEEARPRQAPGPARRRARPGVMKHKGGTKRLN